MAKYVVSWSGGKDSCLAYWKAVCQGLEVAYLLNLVNKDSGKSMSHGLDPKLIALQAQAVGLPIIYRAVTWESYETEFKAALRELKPEGITGLVAGDVNLHGAGGWMDRICGEVDVEPVLPLWGMDGWEMLNGFIDAGFRAIVISVKTDFFGKEWLGQSVDKNLLSRLKWKPDIDPLGESGEYHTFVTGGPAFKREIKIEQTARVLRDARWSLDILRYSLG